VFLVVFGLNICDTVLLFFKRYPDFRLFEEVGYFPHFMAVIRECGQFRVVYIFLPV